MENNLKIATWNLCLGLASKKDLVTKYLELHEISVCCMQETEIPNNYPTNMLNCNDFTLELENSDYKKRTGIYLKSNISYTRRADLEEENFHIVIIDLDCTVKLRIINLY